ncbi:DUF6359 domain-containing protein [Virgibacillus sp. FSP13]
MKQMNWKKLFNIGLIFILIFSFFTPMTGSMVEAADDGISVSEAIENNSGEATVRGFIVGYAKSKTNVVTTANGDTNIVIAESPDETDTSKMLFVKLPSELRAKWGLASNPDNMALEIEVTGNLEAYFGAPGLKSTSNITAVDDSITVLEAIENNSGKATVKGYIVGHVKSENNVTDTANDDYNFAIADTVDETDTTKMLYIKIPSSLRAEWGLQTNPSLIGKEVKVTGDLKEYFGPHPGLKETSHIAFVGEGQPDEPGEPGEVIPIADARTQGDGDVTVKGTVTATLKNTIHIQDKTAGIAVRPTSLNVQLGDEITVSGTLDEYRGLLQLSGADLVGDPKQVGVPDPVELTGDQLNEDNESKLATVKNVTLESVHEGNGWANYTATDGTTFIVRDETGQLGLSESATYDSITGIVQEFDGEYQIIPRDGADIVADASVVQPVVATPEAGTIASGTDVKFSTTTKGAKIYYTTNGQDPVDHGQLYSEPITVNAEMTIKAYADKEGLESSEVKEFSYTVYDAEEGIKIHHIQGESHESPLNGTFVNDVEGVVTYVYELNGGNYFHFQTPDDMKDDNPNTAEGLVVYTGSKAADVSVGDLVKVTGKVNEYQIDGYSDRFDTDLPVTQINARDDQGGEVKMLESNVKLPEPIVISDNLPTDVIDNDAFAEFDPEEDAIDFWESLEGMRVKVGNTKAVAPQEHGDLVVVPEDAETETIHGGIRFTEDDKNAERIQFKLQPNGPARDFAVKTGDKFNGPITGVVNYGYQNFKIYADLEDLEDAVVAGKAEPETTTIEKNKEELTIASYNLENFSNNRASDESPDEKAEKLARALATDMESPDIIGVTEVQDNNGQNSGPDDADASESYERLIDAIVETGGVKYKYVNINPEYNQDGGAPDANIRVGFLYNPDRVSLTEGAEPGTATQAVGFEDGKLTLNPGRIDPTNEAFDDSRKPLAAQFDFKGESVVVVANHFNSKSGDTALFGSTQPPKLGSEDQRMEIAKAVNGFVKDVLADDENANVVVLGDLNDYEFSNPIQTLKGNELTNMIDEVPTEDRYTYVYQGNSQVLDHILVTDNLASATEVDILHINADFTDMHGRASDHDPVLVQIDLAGDDEASIIPEKSYDLTNFTTNKLVIKSPSVSISLDDSSEINEGILLAGDYAELDGEGLANTKVMIEPKNAGAIVDFKGNEVSDVVIDGENVNEIRGAEGIQNVTYKNGASSDSIKFTDSKGDLISSPTFPLNRKPIVEKEFTDQTVNDGETISLTLSDYFSDPDHDKLTFTSTLGTIEGTTLTLQLGEGSHIVGVTASDGEKSVTTSFSITVNTGESPVDPYYEDAYGKEGQGLKSALHEIISEQEVLSYSEVWEALKETDEDPNNPDNVILFYSGDPRSEDKNGGQTGDWNREHVWAKSHGDFGTRKGPGTDIHHLRPTDVQVNSSRGNLDFDNGGSPVKNCDECKRANNSWEPPNDVKGDVARMLFYMAVRYEGEDYVDLELNNHLNNGSNPYHGKLSTLLEWHEQDPVDEFESNRNNVIEEWQGNRNPFIDHPEWVEDIW